jgi:hypothetical protein
MGLALLRERVTGVVDVGLRGVSLPDLAKRLSEVKLCLVQVA